MATPMDSVTVPCEQCRQPVPRATATYSTAGQLVCPACAATATLAGNEARAGASRRSMRILTIGSAALVVGVPSIMIAAGAGQHVATGLFILGGILLVGGRQALRMSEPGRRRGALLVMLVGVAAIILGAVLNGAIGRR